MTPGLAEAAAAWETRVRTLEEVVEGLMRSNRILERKIEELTTCGGFEELVSVDEVAAKYGVNPDFFYRGAGRAAPHVKVGSRLRFNPVEVDAWFRGQR